MPKTQLQTPLLSQGARIGLLDILLLPHYHLRQVVGKAVNVPQGQMQSNNFVKTNYLISFRVRVYEKVIEIYRINAVHHAQFDNTRKQQRLHIRGRKSKHVFIKHMHRL